MQNAIGSTRVVVRRTAVPAALRIQAGTRRESALRGSPGAAFVVLAAPRPAGDDVDDLVVLGAHGAALVAAHAAADLAASRRVAGAGGARGS